MNPVDQIILFLILYKEWVKSHLSLILETEYHWHLNDSKYFLWLKVYCEFEHAVQNGKLKRKERWTCANFFLLKKTSLRNSWPYCFFNKTFECTDHNKNKSWSCLFKNIHAYCRVPLLNTGSPHSASNHFPWFLSTCTIILILLCHDVCFLFAILKLSSGSQSML